MIGQVAGTVLKGQYQIMLTRVKCILLSNRSRRRF